MLNAVSCAAASCTGFALVLRKTRSAAGIAARACSFAVASAAGMLSPAAISPTALARLAWSVGLISSAAWVAGSMTAAVANWSLYWVLSVMTFATSVTGLPEISLTASAWVAGSVGLAVSAVWVAGLSFAAVANCALYWLASDCALGTMVGSAATALTMPFWSADQAGVLTRRCGGDLRTLVHQRAGGRNRRRSGRSARPPRSCAASRPRPPGRSRWRPGCASPRSP